jgi:hypothetical protein
MREQGPGYTLFPPGGVPLATPSNHAMQLGPYSTSVTTLLCGNLTSDDAQGLNQSCGVTFPVAANTSKRFPLLVYGHGAMKTFQDANDILLPHSRMLGLLASWGYVVVMPLGCNTPPHQPPYSSVGCISNTSCSMCQGRYFEYLLGAIRWGRGAARQLLPVDATADVALAGHSIGAEAALFAAALYDADGGTAVRSNTWTLYGAPPCVPLC